MPEPLVIGSANRKKARELAEILYGLPWDIKTLADFPPVAAPAEDAPTFEENALAKAQYYSERLALACVADDSGLMVDALDGAPGVYSARYAGPECRDEKNVAKLLDALGDTPWHERTARFVCCATLVIPGRKPYLAVGTVDGHIAAAPCGRNGFGYDPVFVPDGHDRTFAEMSVEEKHAMSHRGRAFRDVRGYLESLR
ncbi:MAG: RdgB/HAM1 family non-canonical purine NTP pyrophosphatase [Candidatus Hydrogenedentes bacterium]|nr:RdgB/HAM1 family non-canonical purine NTP pyrophosphatase [Candidatus Hydrogenedentota bacterium]